MTEGRLPNGKLGLAQSSSPIQDLFSQLFSSGQLVDPVIGLRLDPDHPKMTVGALDPNDYVGAINWVQIEQAQSQWNQSNAFPIDGVLGRNGSILQFPSPTRLLASLDSKFINIAVPDNKTYYADWNQNATSPFSFTDDCFNGTVSISINGVIYPVRTADVFRPDPVTEGVCSRGVLGDPTTNPPAYVLGLPFLRSVYLAYRFPAGSCPGFFGFAFPSGTSQPPSLVSQTPTSTPSLSSQCLALSIPSSTPSPSLPGPLIDTGAQFSVYGEPNAQAHLKGSDALKRGVWGVANTSQ